MVAAAGTLISGIAWGPLAALGFALGSAGSWWNYRQLHRVVKALATAAETGTAPPTGRIVLGLLVRLLAVGGGALVILRYSKVSLIALLVGLFASCIAIGLEISYELIWEKSTNSG